MSSLKDIYQNYLATPSLAALSPDAASLNYITTLTTIKSAPSIVKHLAAHQRLLKKKQETVLTAVESQDAICLDVETTLEFISGGGAYLPGLDDNFLSDRVVTFPMVIFIPGSHRFWLIFVCLTRFISCISMQTERFKPFAYIGTKDLYSNKLM